MLFYKNVISKNNNVAERIQNGPVINIADILWYLHGMGEKGMERGTWLAASCYTCICVRF